MTLSAMGLALTPAGGSVCMRLKSRMSLLRAAVDISLASSQAPDRYSDPGVHCVELADGAVACEVLTLVQS